METMRLINGILRDKCYNGICVDRSYYAVEWNTAHGYDIPQNMILSEHINGKRTIQNGIRI